MRHSIPLFVHARQLRRSSTPEERMLWELVRGKQLGFKFRRQHPFPPFILPFYCPKARVAVELDGAHHVESSDARRDEFLAAKNVVVFRIENRVLREDPDSVVAALETLISARVPLPSFAMSSRRRKRIACGGLRRILDRRRTTTFGAERPPPAPSPRGEGWGERDGAAHQRMRREQHRRCLDKR